MGRRVTVRSTLQEISLEFLLCRALRHAWEDVDMLPMIWGRQRVEHWHLECARCRSRASEYRDSVTQERVGQRQYFLSRGYALDYVYTQAEYFKEIKSRRSGKKAAQGTG